MQLNSNHSILKKPEPDRSRLWFFIMRRFHRIELLATTWFLTVFVEMEKCICYTFLKTDSLQWNLQNSRSGRCNLQASLCAGESGKREDSMCGIDRQLSAAQIENRINSVEISVSAIRCSSSSAACCALYPPVPVTARRRAFLLPERSMGHEYEIHLLQLWTPFGL